MNANIFASRATLAIVLAACVPHASCAPSPAGVAEALGAALNQGDTAAAAQLFAADASIDTAEAQLAGQALIGKWLTTLAASDARFEVMGTPTRSGATLRWRVAISSTEWTALGLTSVEHDATLTTARGKITALSWRPTKAGAATLERATHERNATTMRALSESIKADDTASVMHLLAEDVTVEIMGADPLRGKAAVAVWLASLGAQDAELLLARDRREQHGQPIWAGSMTSDEWRSMGFAKLETQATATFAKSGKVQTLRLTLAPDAATRLASTRSAPSGNARASSEPSEPPRPTP